MNSHQTQARLNRENAVRAEAKQAKQDLISTRRELERVNSENTTLTLSLEDRDAQIQTSTQKLSSLEEKLAELRSRVSQGETRLTRAKEDVSRLTQGLSDKSTALEEAKAANSSLKKSLLDKEDELREVVETGETLEKSVIAKLEDKEDELRKVVETVETLEKSIAAKDEELSKAKRTLATLTEESGRVALPVKAAVKGRPRSAGSVDDRQNRPSQSTDVRSSCRPIKRKTLSQLEYGVGGNVPKPKETVEDKLHRFRTDTNVSLKVCVMWIILLFGALRKSHQGRSAYQRAYYTSAWVLFIIFLVMGGLHIAKGAFAISVVTTVISFVLIFVISAFFALADWKAEEQWDELTRKVWVGVWELIGLAGCVYVGRFIREKAW